MGESRGFAPRFPMVDLSPARRDHSRAAKALGDPLGLLLSNPRRPGEGSAECSRRQRLVQRNAGQMAERCGRGARQLNPRYSASRESLHGGHSTGEGAMSDLVFSAVTATAVIAWMAWITLALFGA